MNSYFGTFFSIGILSISSNFFSAIALQPMTSSEDSSRPQLSCILFGDVACEVSCAIVCDLYGCNSNGTCVQNTYCACNESYEVAGTNVTDIEYRHLSLDQLWYHRFRYTNASTTLLDVLRNDTAIRDHLFVNLREPHKTPQDIIDQLYALLPAYNNTIAELQPIRHGFIDDYLSPNKTFDSEKFRFYLENKIDSLPDAVYTRLQKIEHKDTFAEIARFVNDENDVKYLLRQLFLYPSDFIKVFAQENGYDIDEVLESLREQNASHIYPRRLSAVANGNDIASIPVHTAEEIDEIILSEILEIFIELISGYTD